MYAAFVTMKNQKCYSGSVGLDIMSVKDGEEVPFDATIPQLRIRWDDHGSITNPHLVDVIVDMKDVWLIGKQYSPDDEQWQSNLQKLYLNDDGVNHENAHRYDNKFKSCRRCHSHNVPDGRVVSLCDHCLTLVTR